MANSELRKAAIQELARRELARRAEGKGKEGGFLGKADAATVPEVPGVAPMAGIPRNGQMGVPIMASNPVSSGVVGSGVDFAKATGEALLAPVAPFVKGLRERMFSPTAGKAGPSRILENAGKTVGESVRSSASKTAEDLATSKIGQKFPLTAAAIGATYSTVADVASDSLTPSAMQQNVGAEGIGSAAKVAAPMLKNAGVDAGRRALGFQKSQLVSQKSPFETTRRVAQANRAAQAMLERKAIPLTGNTDVLVENSTKILSEGTNKVKTAIKAVDDAGIRVESKSLDSHLIDSIKPEFDDQYGVTESILKDIKAKTKDGSMSLSDLEDLRRRWGKFGFQDRTVGTTAADVFRNAWKAADGFLKKTIGDTSDDLLRLYTTGKAEQEFAMTAQKGLGNKVAAELGNQPVSLPAIGMGVAFGDPSSALATAAKIGGAEVLKRRAFAPISRLLWGAGRSLEKGTAPGTLTALLSSIRPGPSDNMRRVLQAAGVQ